MSPHSSDKTVIGRLKTIPGSAWVVMIALIVYTVIYTLIVSANPQLQASFRLSLAPFFASASIVQVHIFAALTTFTIGTVLMLGPKGRGYHKPLGWIWVTSMAVTAISSFFMTGLNGASYSWIHGLSAWTVLALPFGVAAVRRRKIKDHRKAMTGMFFGGIIVAGLFSFLPGRVMWHMLFVT